MSSGSFPTTQKTASITPVLKKATLDPYDLSNYRPISNLTFLSKLLERATHEQIVGYLDQSYNLPTGNIDLLKQLQSRWLLWRLRSGRCELCHPSRPSRPQCCVWHGWPSHSTRSTQARLRCQGTDHSMNRVLSHRTQSIRTVQQGHLKDCTSHLRCAAGVRPGADPLHILLGWSRCHRSASGLQSACVRKRPTNIWIDGTERCCWSDGSYVDLYRVRRVVDEFKSTPAQSIQDRVDLAWYKSTIYCTAKDSAWQSVVLMSGQSSVFETSVS